MVPIRQSQSSQRQSTKCSTSSSGSKRNATIIDLSSITRIKKCKSEEPQSKPVVLKVDEAVVVAVEVDEVVQDLDLDLQPNPLRNSVVLNTIFGFFDFEQIKLCRSINHFWRNEATLFLRKKSLVRFSRDHGRDMGKFVQEVKQNENLPLVYDHFYLETITSRDFFELCGERIKHLSIGIWTWRPDKYFTGKMAMKNLRKILSISCPNLESLTLRQSRNTPAGKKKQVGGNGGPETPENIDWDIEPVNLRELNVLNNSASFYENQLGVLLKASENLEKLRIHFYQKQDIVKFLDILEGLCKCGRKSPLPRLKYLRFTSNEFADITFIDKELFRLNQILVVLDVKLKSLEVPFLSKDISVPTIEVLLKNQSLTLEKFTSQQCTPEELPTIKLPTVMVQLNQLTSCHVQISAKDFVRNSPQLRNVSADFNLLQFPLNPPNHLFLQELILEKEISNSDIIWKISKHFPYLKKVTLRRADSTCLKSFFEAFSDSNFFESLCITFGADFSQAFDIESTLTGFSREKCAEILDLDHEDFYPVNEEESASRPSLGIGFLKKLKSLDLEYNGKPRCPNHRGHDWISLISMLYGLAQLKNLKTLTLRQFLLSSRHLIVLPDHIPLNELTLLNCRVRNDCDDMKTIAHRFAQKFPQIRFYQGGY